MELVNTKEQNTNLNDYILVDYYVKAGPDLYPEKYEGLNNRVVAMHKFYETLYLSGVLKQVAFEYRDYDDMVYFAFEVKAIHEFVQTHNDREMINTAVQYMTECMARPCRYTGAIQPGMFTQTYRDNCGCIGKSNECIVAQWLDNDACGMIYNERKTKGVKDAVKMAFELANFK